MPISLAYLVHPIISRALPEAEKNVEDGVRQNENPNSPLSVLTMPPTTPKDDSLPPPTLGTLTSPPPVAPTSTPVPLTPHAEFQIIEAELADCKMTREALARREAVLRERKAEIIREIKMRLDREVRELAAGDEEGDMDEGLYMRDVQRRVEVKLERADRNANEAMEEKPQQTEEAIPISAPERRRLTRLTLFKNDPRLG